MSEFEDGKKFSTAEDVPIIPFRAENLGLIRLKWLAFPDKERVRITVEDEEFIPRGFDVYGHPVISEDNYRYYCALKAIAERKGQTVLAHVEYDDHPFFIRRELFDSIEGIQEAVSSDVSTLKKMLNYRKQFAFYRKLDKNSEHPRVKKYLQDPLHEFVIFGHYKLSKDGHVWLCQVQTQDDLKEVEPIEHVKSIKVLEQFHFPGAEDFCSICGRKFSIDDVAQLHVTEKEDGRKVHTGCFKKFKVALEHEKAAKIIDEVYCRQKCDSRVISRIGQNGEEIYWYEFKTPQGTISITFEDEEHITIKWAEDFKTWFIQCFSDFDVKKEAFYLHHISTNHAVIWLQNIKNTLN